MRVVNIVSLPRGQGSLSRISERLRDQGRSKAVVYLSSTVIPNSPEVSVGSAVWSKEYTPALG